MGFSRRSALWLAGSAALVTGLLIACRPPAPPGEVEGEPLLRGVRPAVLTEAPRLASPAEDSPNRFLSGWIPWRRDGEVLLTTSPEGARIEIVQLKARSRSLVLDLAGEVPAGARVRVMGPPARGETPVGSGLRQLATVPVADPLEIPLPADLPLGRVVLELEVLDAPALTVREGALRPALAAGRAEWRTTAGGSSLTVQGVARAEVVAPTARGRLLRGRFIPPRGAGGEYHLRIEDGAGRPRATWTWKGSPLASWLPFRSSSEEIALPLDDSGGWARLTFSHRPAEGVPGPEEAEASGRWEGLHWVDAPRSASDAAEAPAVSSPAALATLPRLVVVYVMDTLRADQVGHLGGPAGISPTFDRLAAEGWSFHDHRSPAPKTRPSTWSLFTGWPFRGTEAPTLAERFRHAGWRTAMFSGNPNVSPAFGLDRGFDHVAEEVLFPAYGETDDGVINDNAAQVHRAALEWLDGLGGDERAFLYLHTVHPHSPYTPPEPFQRDWTEGVDSTLDGLSRTLFDVKQGRIDPTAEDRRQLRGLYAGNFAYNDHELAALLAELEERFPGELLLALTSDHGEEFFDHGGVLHGHTLYREQLRVPLVLWWPGVLEPRRVTARTHTLDLHTTLLELLGQEPGGAPGGFAGRGLLPEPEDHPVRFASESYHRPLMLSAESERWKVVWALRTGHRWGQGEGIGRGHDAEAWFDLMRDPEEAVNRVGRGDLEARWLRQRLMAWRDAFVEAMEEGGEEGSAEALDEETRQRLRALGYVD